MEIIKTSSKGQIVIPKSIREALGIRSGTELKVELLPGTGFTVTLERAGHVAKVRALAASLARFANRRAAKSDEESLLEAVRKDDARALAYGVRRRAKKRR
jgi:AbrB family looped-hinge helix DNA binding protein